MMEQPTITATTRLGFGADFIDPNGKILVSGDTTIEQRGMFC